MKKLIITAHPSSKGFTHKIAKSYKKSSENIGDKVEIINLYDKKYHQDFLFFEEVKEISGDKNRKLFQEKISYSDEIVFIFPIWWGNMPAILKNFFDVNLSQGFAFNFLKGGKVEKLLSSKKSKIFVTCDAPGFIYKFPLFPINLEKYFKMYILGFCGIKVTNFLLFDSMGKTRKDSDKREKMLEKVCKIAQK